MILNKFEGTFLYNPLCWLNNKRLFCMEQRQLKQYVGSTYSNKLKEKSGSKTGRCFLLGNGPSLTIEDLELLYRNNVDTFAANRIYSLFGKTKWRPTYYFCQDNKVMSQIYNDLLYAVEESQYSFFSINNFNHSNELLQNKKSFFYFIRHLKDNDIGYSDDVSHGVFEGMTVIYSMAQIAIYMGYKEIYLLGVDHNFKPAIGVSNDKENHFEGVKQIDDSKLYPPNYILMNKAFSKLRDYCDTHGIIIKNATRGGLLEIFERVDIDTLFGENV